MRILGISGSLRKDSHNTALLRAAAELLPPGVELELFDGLRESRPTTRTRTRPGSTLRPSSRSRTPSSAPTRS